MYELTGKFKHYYEGFWRKGFVLYVQYRGEYQSLTDPNDPKNGDSYTAYRKATPNDFYTLAQMGVLLNGG